jgi:hypothetical protein
MERSCWGYFKQPLNAEGLTLKTEGNIGEEKEAFGVMRLALSIGIKEKRSTVETADP